MPSPLSLRDEAIQAAEATVDGTQVDAVAIPPMVDAVLGVLTTRIEQLRTPAPHRSAAHSQRQAWELRDTALRDALAVLGVAPATPGPQDAICPACEGRGRVRLLNSDGTLQGAASLPTHDHHPRPTRPHQPPDDGCLPAAHRAAGTHRPDQGADMGVTQPPALSDWQRIQEVCEFLGALSEKYESWSIEPPDELREALITSSLLHSLEAAHHAAWAAGDALEAHQRRMDWADEVQP